ncbi:MAG: hypothetical protein NC350_01545 [Corallococcus sp.]|nr:hypothetical protein [Corallococcus sp.]
MKKSNKIFVALLAVAMAVTCLFAFAACEENQPLEGTVKIYVGDKMYSVNLKEAQMNTGNSVFDALEYISSTDKTFTYQGSFSGTGAFISSIGSLVPDTSVGEYVAFYMNDSTKKDVSAWALPDETVEGTTVYYSGYGISGVKLTDGLVAYFKLVVYNG